MTVKLESTKAPLNNHTGLLQRNPTPYEPFGATGLCDLASSRGGVVAPGIRRGTGFSKSNGKDLCCTLYTARAQG